MEIWSNTWRRSRPKLNPEDLSAVLSLYLPGPCYGNYSLDKNLSTLLAKAVCILLMSLTSRVFILKL